jgi:hypothetical protein
MPHYSDTRCGLFRISLNKSIIHEMILGMGYEEREKKSWEDNFDCYVEDIENMIPSSQLSNFETWFYDNYNNTEIFDDIFKPEEELIEIESDSEDEETSWGKKKCNDCKKELPSFCRTIDKIDYCLSCAPKYEKN